MAQPTSDIQRVLVVDADARVRAALAALIDATPGLQVAATASIQGAGAIARSADATVAVVDVDALAPEDDLVVIRQLAEHLPVVAVCYGTAGGIRAVAAGATAFCDKNGGPDALITAVSAAAAHRSMSQTVRPHFLP